MQLEVGATKSKVHNYAVVLKRWWVNTVTQMVGHSVGQMEGYLIGHVHQRVFDCVAPPLDRHLHPVLSFFHLARFVAFRQRQLCLGLVRLSEPAASAVGG
jgi:hypothetical protein